MQYNLYISHSFEHSEKYDRLVDFLREEGLPTMNLSVPVGRQLPGDLKEVQDGIAERIRWCNRVIVLATEHAHKSPFMDYEMRVAGALGKTIIGVYPHGANEKPIPQVLSETHYRMVGWRRGSIAKAIEGKYPPERRVFEVAEVEERRALATQIGKAAATTTLVVAGLTSALLGVLLRELKQRGITIVNDVGPSFLETVGPATLIGAAGGVLLSIILTGDVKSVGRGILLGGAIGAGIGITHHMSMRIEALSPLLSTITMEPIQR